MMPADHALLLLASNPDGTFQAAHAYPTPFSVAGLFVADANRDGHPDVVLSDSGQYPATYLGRGDGSFLTPPITTGVGGSNGCAFSIYPGDFNGDGILDYACWEFAQLGNGDGTFGSNIPLPLHVPGNSNWNGFSAGADFNNDGLTDFVGAYGQGIALAISTAPSTYVGSSTLLSGIVGPMISADFDGDGCADLATTTGPPRSSSSVGTASATSFQPPPIPPASPVDPTGQVTDIATTDLDRDGIRRDPLPR